MSKLNVYAWNKPGITNFGDELGPDILRRLGHTVNRVPVEQAEVIVCGSVIEKAARAPKGTVLAGAGVMHGHTSAKASHFDIRALRGRLSWLALGAGMPDGPGDVPLGDPGILVADLYDTAPRQYGKVGVVPHYVDQRQFPYADVVIDIQAPPSEVVWEISKCSYILSSSLHGLIAAQSLGIPAQRLPYSKVLGKDTKWVDYATGVAESIFDAENELYHVLESL